jgi:hypothetical protein
MIICPYIQAAQKGKLQDKNNDNSIFLERKKEEKEERAGGLRGADAAKAFEGYM